MISFYIYHIPGIKVGCSKDPVKRNNKSTNIEILEVLKFSTENEQAWKRAGDREWYWHEKLGYKKNPAHYAQTRKSSILGGKAAILLPTHPFRTGVANKACAGKNGRRTAELGKSGMQTKVRCPHCKKLGQTRAMGRWHFDNCKDR